MRNCSDSLAKAARRAWAGALVCLALAAGAAPAGAAADTLVYASSQVSGVPVRDAAGKLVGYRGTGADITARKAAEERIQYLATRDALTGLPNRALLADRAGQAILSAARGRSQLALLLFDLDGGGATSLGAMPLAEDDGRYGARRPARFR